MTRLKYSRSPRSKRLDAALEEAARAAFPPGARLAVKLHMGEGAHHFDLQLTVRIVSLAKELGMKPFLFDSPVMYSGERHTAEGYLARAEKNGFSEETIGCPVVVSDSSRAFQGKYLRVGVCRDLTDADGLLVLSHVKGHPCTGAGGALKNLGMGGVDRKTKTAIHAGSKPVLTGDCDACGLCAEGCPGSSITIAETVQIDLASCWACGRCIDVCPNGALKPIEETFDALLIDGAAAVLSRAKNVLYMNDVRSITRLCDCCRNPGPKIAPDVGVLLGSDPVAMDKASVDLAIAAAGGDVFNREHGRDPYSHIHQAAARGLGSGSYRLEDA